MERLYQNLKSADPKVVGGSSPPPGTIKRSILFTLLQDRWRSIITLNPSIFGLRGLNEGLTAFSARSPSYRDGCALIGAIA